MHGRGNDRYQGHSGAGYRYLRSAFDDRTRIVYSEILDDEQAATRGRVLAARSRTVRMEVFAAKRVLTDNGSCYRSGLSYQACAASGTTVKKTDRDDRRPTAKVCEHDGRAQHPAGLTQVKV